MLCFSYATFFCCPIFPMRLLPLPNFPLPFFRCRESSRPESSSVVGKCLKCMDLWFPGVFCLLPCLDKLFSIYSTSRILICRQWTSSSTRVYRHFGPRTLRTLHTLDLLHFGMSGMSRHFSIGAEVSFGHFGTILAMLDSYSGYCVIVVQQSHFIMMYFNLFYRKFAKYLHSSCATVSIYFIYFFEIGDPL